MQFLRRHSRHPKTADRCTFCGDVRLPARIAILFQPDIKIIMTILRMDEVDNRVAELISRELAHVRFQHEEGNWGYCLVDTQSHRKSQDEKDHFSEYIWTILEAYEHGELYLPDEDVVALIEDRLFCRHKLDHKLEPIRTVTGPDGKPDACLAYPRIMNAVENQIGHGSSHEEEASAYTAKACMKRVTGRDAAAVKFFKKALQRRPNDWRLLYGIACAYTSLEKMSLALDEFNRAIELADEKSFVGFNLMRFRGAVLYELRRFEEAKSVFLKVNIDLERYRGELNLSLLERASFIAIEYSLTLIWIRENNTKMIKHQWNSAEAKRNALPPDIRERINPGLRLIVAEEIKEIHPGFLGDKECSYCCQLCLDPMICSGCKVAQYCNATCQKAHWKAGHKRHCQVAKTTRKTNKKNRNEKIKRLEAVMRLPPLDATLHPRDLWAKAEKLSNNPSKALDSVFLFTVASFLDSNLGDLDMSAARAAVDACDPINHPLAIALQMMPNMKESLNSNLMGISFLSAIDHLHSYSATSDDDHYHHHAETLGQLDRFKFGCAMCAIFRARMSIRMNRWGLGPCSEEAIDPLNCIGDDRLAMIRNVEKFLPSQRWLTLQFEIACMHYDVGAMDEAKYRLQIFVDNLTNLEQNDGELTKHWKKFRKFALCKLEMIQNNYSEVRKCDSIVM